MFVIELGWNKSCIDVKVGAHCTAVKVYSAPDDGRKGRPKHVEHTCIVNKHNTARVATCWFIIHRVRKRLYPFIFFSRCPVCGEWCKLH